MKKPMSQNKNRPAAAMERPQRTMRAGMRPSQRVLVTGGLPMDAAPVRGKDGRLEWDSSELANLFAWAIYIRRDLLMSPSGDSLLDRRMSEALLLAEAFLDSENSTLIDEPMTPVQAAFASQRGGLH